MVKEKGFEGWYFKHQKGDNTLAFIPGRAESGAFIQMISADNSRQFKVSDLSVKRGAIYADKCIFSHYGCLIDLPEVSGKIAYGKFSPLNSDIMGPFQFLPMECRHGVISMKHTLRGSMKIDGVVYDFNNGNGYIEKDSGTSFPRSYLWLQCNDFDQPCSIMISVAHIPFLGAYFIGCICAILYRKVEYRLATYKGVHIHVLNGKHICLSQGDLFLEIDISPKHSSHQLLSPILGQMTGTIRESSNADVRVCLWKKNALIFDLFSNYASYEFVP